MTIVQQVQQHAGAIGASVTASSTVTSFLTSAMPILQFIAVCVSIGVGCITFAWYVKRFRTGK